MGLWHELKTLDAEKAGLHIVTDEEMCEMHRILLLMLDDIKKVCDKHHIEWGISGGCALGAVRHKGFIPWDDDVDIYFTRKNFNKFRKVYPLEKDSKYELICSGDSGYYALMPRVFNTETTIKMMPDYGDAKGIFIDIFVLENTYDNDLLRFIHGIQCTAYLFIVSCVTTRYSRKLLYKYSSRGLRKQVRIRSFFGWFFGYRKPDRWIRKAIRCFSKVRNNKSKYVVSVAGGGHYFGEMYDRTKMCEYQILPFEDRAYPFMKDTDYFCKMRFGDDYMQLPPESRRERHAYIEFDLEK